MSNIKVTHPIIVGKIGKPHGILGWLKIYSFTEIKTNIFKYQPWYIKNKKTWTLLKITYWKSNKCFFIVKFATILNRNQAEKLINTLIIVDESTFPKLGYNEFYWKDIIKCDVFTINNFYLGTVKNIITTNINDVMILDNKFVHNEKKNLLIPFIHKIIIQNIDISKKIIHVNWNL